MIPIKKLNELSPTELENLFNRYGTDFSSIISDVVIPIVTDVKTHGDEAVIKYTEKFDKVQINSVLAEKDEIEEGALRIPTETVDAFKKAKLNIEEFHKHQLRESIKYKRGETELGVLYQAIEKAAVYAPGGTALYPSSVMMGVIPAQIAGTKEITLITPPDKNGNVPDIMCAICKLLDVNSIIKSGGVQGIAAAALGTQTVKKSNIIVGPGNIYVTAAKTYLFSLGIIQIDSPAGPSDVLIISDASTKPKWIAYDLLSQAEHDPMSVAVLLTTSSEYAEQVKNEIEADIQMGKGRIDIKKKALQNSIIIIVPTIEEAIEFSNKYAPEHMQFMVENATDYIDKIRNVGSLFIGNYSPVAVGDYYSGTNHILPTGGTARFSSGTSVDTFMRRTTYQCLTLNALKEAQKPISIMSKVEGFDDKHGGSVDVRFEAD